VATQVCRCGRHDVGAVGAQSHHHVRRTGRVACDPGMRRDETTLVMAASLRGVGPGVDRTRRIREDGGTCQLGHAYFARPDPSRLIEVVDALVHEQTALNQSGPFELWRRSVPKVSAAVGLSGQSNRPHGTTCGSDSGSAGERPIPLASASEVSSSPALYVPQGERSDCRTRAGTTSRPAGSRSLPYSRAWCGGAGI
jgi:hypothetical protein